MVLRPTLPTASNAPIPPLHYSIKPALIPQNATDDEIYTSIYHVVQPTRVKYEKLTSTERLLVSMQSLYTEITEVMWGSPYIAALELSRADAIGMANVKILRLGGVFREVEGERAEGHKRILVEEDMERSRRLANSQEMMARLQREAKDESDRAMEAKLQREMEAEETAASQPTDGCRGGKLDEATKEKLLRDAMAECKL